MVFINRKQIINSFECTTICSQSLLVKSGAIVIFEKFVKLLREGQHGKC